MGGWLDQALENGYEIIPIETEIVKKLERLGYSGTVLPQSRYRQLNHDVSTIDFSGWALVTHKWLPDRVAYAAIETIDEKQKFIPVDDDQPLNMRELCQGSEKCPLRMPLHRGAAKYYKEKGYLTKDEGEAMKDESEECSEQTARTLSFRPYPSSFIGGLRELSNHRPVDPAHG